MKQTKLWLATIAVLWCNLTASAYDFEVNGIYYNLVSASDLTVEVTSGDNYYSGDIILPSTINYSGKAMIVTSIGNYAFSSCFGLTSITIPNSVTNIGNSAFSFCSGLTSITIPSSVTNIVGNPFSFCDGLTNIVVESSNTAYDSRDNCNAIIETNSNTLIAGSKNTTIPNSVTDIGIEAFRDCSGLTSITIPNSVTNIEYSAFYGCDGLTSVTIGDCVTSIGSDAFHDCFRLTNFTIPNSVISIGRSAFEGTAWYNSQPDGLIYKDDWLLGYKGNSRPIFDIAIQDGTKHIAENALAHCSGITSIEIPNSVTSIGAEAFRDCNGLTSITIPNSVTSIEDNAFTGCNAIEKLELNCSEINSWFRGNQSVREIVIGNNVTSIAEYAFSYCSGLTSITIPNSVTSIGEYAFSYCDELTSVTIGNGITSIGYNSFSDCNAIEKLELNCPEIGFWFCWKPSIKEVTLGNSVTNIGNNAFSGCSGITSIEIPSSVTNIGNHAFSNCSGLTSIVIPNSVTNIGNGAFSNCSGLTSIDIPNSITSIENNAFSYCSGLTNITIPNNVTSIEEYAFSCCDGLASVVIGNGVTCIGNNAFDGCSGLINITIGNSVTSIGNGAFYGCNAIEKLELNCPEIDSWFRDEQSIKEVTLGNSVTNIGEFAFYGCSGITDITIPNSVASVGRWAFEKTAWYDNQPDGIVYAGKVLYKYKETMPENTDITIKEGTLGITSAAFQYCSGLTSITIPNSVSNIGERAFEGCYALKKINSFISAENLFVPDDYAFEGVNKETCTLYVPEGDVSAYQSTAGWNEFEHIVDFDPYFTITYLVDGEVYSTETAEYGSEIILIDEPVREGHTFNGWSEVPKTMPANDVTVYGTFTANKYLITFKIDDEVIFSAPIEYGTSIVAPEAPEKDGYSFDGWIEMPETMPAHDVIVYGTFTKLKVETIVINDSDFSFSMTENTECGEIIYTRTFNNTDWQALYIPFEIAYEDICDDFEIADINNVHQYDYNEDGKTDETIIEAFKATSGTLEANYPYLIRAKEAGEKTIVVTDATLYATEENSIDCSSVREKFTFTGTYKSNTLPQGEGYYTLIDGEWNPVTEAVTLGAFRFFLKVDSRSGGAAAEARSIRLRIIGENGEDDTTRIDNLGIRNHQSEIIYDLQGRRVENPTKGIYIVNGKRVVIK